MEAMTSENKGIAGLVDYIAARAPDFAEKSKGASGAEIDELESVAGPLPADYREFLSLMGGAPTAFPFFYDASHEVADVVEKYRILRDDEEETPADSVLVAVYGFQVEEIAVERATAAHENARGGRVFVPDGDFLGDRFLEYLYGQAFKYTVGARASLTGTLIGARRAPQLDRLAAAAGRFGLEKHWFSDSVTLCAADAREQTVLYARQKADDFVWARVSGENRALVTELKNALAGEADLNFEKWWD